MLQETAPTPPTIRHDSVVFSRAILNQVRNCGTDQAGPRTFRRALRDWNRYGRRTGVPGSSPPVRLDAAGSRGDPERLDRRAGSRLRGCRLRPNHVRGQYRSRTSSGFASGPGSSPVNSASPLRPAHAPGRTKLMKLDSFFEFAPDVPAAVRQIAANLTGPARARHPGQQRGGSTFSGRGHHRRHGPGHLEPQSPRLSAIPPGTEVVIDLSGVPFADSSGVGFMVRLKKRAWQRGVKVTYAPPRRRYPTFFGSPVSRNTFWDNCRENRLQHLVIQRARRASRSTSSPCSRAMVPHAATMCFTFSSWRRTGPCSISPRASMPDRSSVPEAVSSRGPKYSLAPADVPARLEPQTGRRPYSELSTITLAVSPARAWRRFTTSLLSRPGKVRLEADALRPGRGSTTRPSTGADSAVSENTARDLPPFGVGPERVSVVWNGMTIHASIRATPSPLGEWRRVAGIWTVLIFSTFRDLSIREEPRPPHRGVLPIQGNHWIRRPAGPRGQRLARGGGDP